MAIDPKSPPVVQLFAALQAEDIGFMVAGMSAANLQGVLAATVDVDVWIGLPARQYIRVINLCRKLNVSVQSPNKVYLSDQTPVDFIYEIGGLQIFEKEYARAERLAFHGLNNSRLVPETNLQKQGSGWQRQRQAAHFAHPAGVEIEQGGKENAAKNKITGCRPPKPVFQTTAIRPAPENLCFICV